MINEIKNDNDYIICLITEPIGYASKAPVSNLVNLLLPLSNEIKFITGNIGCNLFKDNKKIRSYGMQYKLGSNFMVKIIRYLSMQLKISYIFINVGVKSDLVIFFIGSNTLLLPIIATKLFRKKVVLVLSGSFKNTLKFANNWFWIPVEILEKLNYSLANFIVLYSQNFIDEYEMNKYEKKILINHEHYIDFNKFKINIGLNERGNVIGYIGRLSEEKGILNFVSSISVLANEMNEREFLIVGDGSLREGIENYFTSKNLSKKVKIVGWIPHEELPEYFNHLKLLVIPSYTEGLPNIMLEAMACGTPVLATPVGAIPDIIKDSETGFIMESNSPNCIAANVVRALEHPDLENIAKRARIIVENNFSYDKVVDQWKQILSIIKKLR